MHAEYIPPVDSKTTPRRRAARTLAGSLPRPAKSWATSRVPTQGGHPFLQSVLDQVEDGELLTALASEQSPPGTKGRHPYPVRTLWRAWLTKYVLNIRYTVDLVGRLRTSRRLREVCGVENQVPSESTFSRFFKRLSRPEHQVLVEDCLNQLTGELKGHIPDIGESVAIDSTDVEAWANPNRKHLADSEARWGVRTSARAKDGTEYYFGFKLHVLADANHGIPLGFVFTPANKNDAPMLTPVLDRATGGLPWLKPQYLVADRGYDSAKNHNATVERGIVPIIHIRVNQENAPVYNNVAGAPKCLGNVPMEYVRTDPETGHHLFRCPTKGCRLKEEGSKGWRHCDTELWEDPMDNLRVVGVVARQSKEWNRHYAKRQSVERLFSSTKHSRLLDTHRFLGARKIQLHTAMSMVAYQATVLARVRGGDFKNMRTMRVAAR